MPSTGFNIQIHPLSSPRDRELIREIGGWYAEEWGAPAGELEDRLSVEADPGRAVIFHLAATATDGKPVAAGGLYNEVNLFRVHGRFREYGPWVGLLYTRKEYRNRGFGSRLLERIEAGARERGFERIYLYTFTAESLYRRSGWTEIDQVPYKGHETVVMQKIL